MDNLFFNIPADIPEELVEALLDAAHVRIERFISQGHTSPEGFWCDQEKNDFVLLVRGSARLRFEDEVVEMKPGDLLNIPAHRKHRVEWTTPDEPTIWLAGTFLSNAFGIISGKLHHPFQQHRTCA